MGAKHSMYSDPLDMKNYEMGKYYRVYSAFWNKKVRPHTLKDDYLVLTPEKIYLDQSYYSKFRVIVVCLSGEYVKTWRSFAHTDDPTVGLVRLYHLLDGGMLEQLSEEEAMLYIIGE